MNETLHFRAKCVKEYFLIGAGYSDLIFIIMGGTNAKIILSAGQALENRGPDNLINICVCACAHVCIYVFVFVCLSDVRAL